MSIHQEIRAQFEDYAFTQYERARLSVALGGERVREKLTRDECLATDKNGNYRNDTTALMWIGWKLCLDAIAPILEAATLWKQWAEIQDRAAEELPVGYFISWGIGSKYEPWDGAGLVSIGLCLENGVYNEEDGWSEDLEIGFPDPADMDSPGLFVRMFESALQAAKDHNAARLN